jgi:hypothetical protein
LEKLRVSEGKNVRKKKKREEKYPDCQKTEKHRLPVI